MRNMPSAFLCLSLLFAFSRAYAQPQNTDENPSLTGDSGDELDYEIVNVPQEVTKQAKRLGIHADIIAKAKKQNLSSAQFVDFYKAEVEKAVHKKETDRLELFKFIQENPEDALSKYAGEAQENQDPDAYFAKGYAEAILKNYKLSVKDYTRAIQLDPDGNNGEYYQKRGEVYFELSEYDKALLDTTRAINTNAQNWELFYLRARINIGLGKYEEGVIDLKRYFSMTPNQWVMANEARGHVCGSLVLKGYSIDGCNDRKYFESHPFPAFSPPQVDASVDVRLLQPIDITYPIDSKLADELKDIQDNIKKYAVKHNLAGRAIASFYGIEAFKALDNRDKDYVGYSKMALLLLRKGLQFYPDADLYYQAANVESELADLKEGGVYQQAIDDYGEALKNVKKSLADIYLQQALRYKSVADFDKALDDLNQLAKLDPENEEVYKERCRVYIATRNYDQAAEDLNKFFLLEKDKVAAEMAAAGPECEKLVLTGRQVDSCKDKKTFEQKRAQTDSAAPSGPPAPEWGQK